MAQEVEKKRPYKFGLALSGGGAKGFAHLGVLQALLERGLVPEIISGTSAGAFAGVLYADGNSPKEILKMFENKAFNEFAQFSIPHAGLFKTNRFEAFLHRNIKARKYEDLKIPLISVATDIEEGKSVSFSEGSLIPTIIASCSFPVVFMPKEINGKHYIDGGLFRNFPVSVIRPMCDFVIGVNASPLTGQKFRSSMLYVAERSFHYMSSSNSMPEKRLCDILIESQDFTKYTTFDLDHVKEIYQLGYDVANQVLDKHIDKIQKIIELQQTV